MLIKRFGIKRVDLRLEVITQFLGDTGLRFAEDREVDVHLGHWHRSGDGSEMNVITRSGVKAIDKVGAIIHAGPVGDAG